MSEYFVHKSSFVDEGAQIGKGTKVWHFSHVSKGAKIGENCSFGQNVFVADGVMIGNNVKIQNNVSIYAGVTVEDDVFLGPSCVLTNVTNPRSQVSRKDIYEKTLIRRGATIGANATIVCGIELGAYCFIAAGSVVTKAVADYALIVGSPGKQVGWMSRHGHKLGRADSDGEFICPESGYRYKVNKDGALRCLDVNEDAELPADKSVGQKTYNEFKKEME